MKWIIYSVILFLQQFFNESNLYTQWKDIIILDNILLPDSLTAKKLLQSLDNFLDKKDAPAIENFYISKGHLPETILLLDEMKDIEKSEKHNDLNFYKCYLSNLLMLNSNKYLIQLSYIGYYENNPILRAAFTLMTKQIDTNFYFYSPLEQNTKNWQLYKEGNINFYYKEIFNEIIAKHYLLYDEMFSSKLGSKAEITNYCFCDNLNEALRLFGVDYKSNYNGYVNGSFYTFTMGIETRINANKDNNFDPHDMWHEKLRTVVSTDSINKPVDEGCAYLYGGSWGIPWNEILSSFKEFTYSNPDADWYSLYIEEKNFAEGKKRLNIAYVINALIVDKIEKENGFHSVLELLCCGKRVKGDKNYFSRLDKITGINEANFNSQVWKLINQYK